MLYCSFTNQHRVQRMNSIQSFLSKRALAVPYTFTPVDELYDAYTEFSKNVYIDKKSFIQLVDEILERDEGVGRRPDWPFYVGLVLKRNVFKPRPLVITESGHPHEFFSENRDLSYLAYKKWCFEKNCEPINLAKFKEYSNAK